MKRSIPWIDRSENEAETLTGAAQGARKALRETHRNGYRDRDWDTRAGRIELAIPKLRKGSYFPSFLDPRRTAALPPRGEGAGGGDPRQAYVHGVSTRAVDEPSGQARTAQQG